ncbi:MAG TPA: Xaa-Pro peptidase family protein [Terriglobales bacterium]|nr:Xaa-Pro peptidase family protein [Terriglobales bacterium]
MYSERLQRLQRSVALHKLDFFLTTHLPNIRYLTGFTGSAGVLIIEAGGRNVFITDGRYKQQAREQVERVTVTIAKKAPLVAVAEWLRSRVGQQGKTSALGIEPAHLTVADRDRLAAVLAHKIRIKSAPPLVEQQRKLKDQTEIDLIREAVLTGAALFDTLLNAIRPGRKENAVAAELEYAARKAGCEGMSFETIIASGSRSALPHGRASDESISRTGFVVCDFGVILAGYCSDMTRTVYVGQATREARNFYAAVREAQLAGIDAVRPGMPVAEVDRVGRSVLKKAGLGRYFTHSTGHGVGLEIHEAPRIASDQAEILQPGMVITIEPGAYVPGKWGVRVEDMVVVTERGHEVLTPTSKDLICI